jgi:hypothetical protein
VREKTAGQVAGQPPQHARAQQDADQYLADYGRLPAPPGERAEQ